MSNFNLVSYFMSILQNQNKIEILFNFDSIGLPAIGSKIEILKNLEYAKSFQDPKWIMNLCFKYNFHYLVLANA
jgi:hypothetical protein